ncbi:hypothetical protein CLAIMM_09027 [Cladophialophora immunda]|nr:hypothetical protein CLAIMM_09027 [Cladophialophora immunda]
MRYAESALDVAPAEAVKLLQEMDRVVTYQLTKWSDGSLNHHWSEFLPLGGQRSDDGKSTFFSFITSCGFHIYLHWQYQNGFMATNKPGRPLLDFAVHPQPQFKGHPGNSLTVKCLLENGTDPNELVAGQTAYYRLLVMSYRYQTEIIQTNWSKELKEMGILFRYHGADLSADQLDALQKEDGIKLSKEGVDWLLRQHGFIFSAEKSRMDAP